MSDWKEAMLMRAAGHQIEPPPGWEELLGPWKTNNWVIWESIDRKSDERLTYEDGVLEIRTRGWEICSNASGVTHAPECLPLFRQRLKQLWLEKETEATTHTVQWDGVYRGTERNMREVGYCVDCRRYVYDGDGELHRKVEATDGQD